jgi:vacuolar-type H+-ATPase subunit I/STV1
LNRDGIGDRYWMGLVSTVRLPSQHTHPEVRKAAEQVLATQAELDEVRRKLAARPAEREELMKSARHLPDRAERLQVFNSETDYLESFDLAEAGQALHNAWEAFGASVAVFHGEWQEYLHRVGRERAEAAAAIVEGAISVLRELQLIDDLIAREQILIDPQTEPERVANFKRNERRASLAMQLNGQDLGTQGVQFGLIPLLLEYRRVFSG